MAPTFPLVVRNGNAGVSRREIAVFDPQVCNHALGVTLSRYIHLSHLVILAAPNGGIR